MSDGARDAHLDSSGRDAADATASADAPDAGTNFVLTPDPGGPSDLALDQDYVYWTSYNTGTIQRIPKTGGSPQLLTPIPHGGNPTVDVDDTSVYFSADTGSNTFVGSVPKSGGTITVLAPQQFAARRVRVKDGFVYWLTGSGPSTPGSPMRAPVGGGAANALTTNTYLTNAWLAVDDQYAYWTDYGDLGPTSGQIFRAPRDGSGPVVTPVTGLDSPYGIAADGSNLFVGLGAHPNTTNGKLNGTILSLNKLAAPPAPTTVLKDNQAEPLAVAVDDTFVYWGDHLSGSIMKAPKTGGPAVPIVSGSGGFESIAVDDLYVYWIFSSVGNGYVARAPKSP
jgi:hypothetical protein